METGGRYGFSTTTTPLHVAVEHDHVRIVKHLLKVGADVDKTDSSGRTPLDVAVSKKVSTYCTCLLYTSPSPRDRQKSRMPSSA